MSWHVDTLNALLKDRLVVVSDLAAGRVRTEFAHITEVKACGPNGFLFVTREEGTYTDMTPQNTWIDAERRSLTVEREGNVHTTQRVFTVVNLVLKPREVGDGKPHYKRYENSEAYQQWVEAEREQGKYD